MKRLWLVWQGAAEVRFLLAEWDAKEWRWRAAAAGEESLDEFLYAMSEGLPEGGGEPWRLEYEDAE